MLTAKLTAGAENDDTGLIADDGVRPGYGYNPIFCVPPILYGVTAGLFQGYLVKKRTLPRLALSVLSAVLLTSILYQGASLTLD